MWSVAMHLYEIFACLLYSVCLKIDGIRVIRICTRIILFLWVNGHLNISSKRKREKEKELVNQFELRARARAYIYRLNDTNRLFTLNDTLVL